MIKDLPVRRKLFYFTLCLLILLYFMEFAGVSLKSRPDAGLTTGTHRYTAIVKQVREKDAECYTLRVRLYTMDGTRLKDSPDALLTYYQEVKQPWKLQRSRITFSAALGLPQPAGNPHCFDYADYLKSCDIRLIGTLTSFQLAETEENSFASQIWRRYERFLIRQKFLFAENLKPESKGLLMGVLFGETAYLDEDAIQQFRDNGTAHILAVSGLHVGILYGLYQRLTRNRTSAPCLALLGLFLFSYGTLSAWSPSTVRAVLMVVMSVAGRLLDLRYDMLTALSAVCLLLILDNPDVILGTAFQMSFLAICSIAFFEKILPKQLPDSLASALAVNLGLILYQAYQFHTVSLVSLVANIPVIYLTGYFVPLAMLCFLLFGICGELYAQIAPFLDAMARLLLFVNNGFTLGGASAVDVTRPPLWLTIFFLGGAFFAASETCLLLRLRKKRKQICGCLLLILLLALGMQGLTYSPITHDDVIFVDVGQGDGIHLRCGGKNLLIDGGGSIRYDVGQKTLKPYFLGNGVGSIDLALATHRHTDHYLGQSQLAENFRVRKRQVGLTAGMTIRFGKDENVWLETLWPLTLAEDPQQEENHSCSVFMLHYRGYRVLITGDLDEEGELAMLAYYQGRNETERLRADVLKVGHHGSKTSSAAAFLDVVNPRIAVIQVGKNNYGHPSPEVLERLTARGVQVFRNDVHGAIGLQFQGKNGIRVDTMRKAAA